MTKSRTTAAILALLLGGIGAHKFYLGRAGTGIIYLIFCWTGIPLVIGVIEAVNLLSMCDQEFDAKYNMYSSMNPMVVNVNTPVPPPTMPEIVARNREPTGDRPSSDENISGD